MLSTAHFSFLPGHLTTTNLLYANHPIHKELNSGNCVDTILFDISKAFDIVLHFTLPYTLISSFGIMGKLYAWNKAILKDSTLSVEISPNLFSLSSSDSCSLIQRSTLRPILYAAYINDIVKCF